MLYTKTLHTFFLILCVLCSVSSNEPIDPEIKETNNGNYETNTSIMYTDSSEDTKHTNNGFSNSIQETSQNSFLFKLPSLSNTLPDEPNRQNTTKSTDSTLATDKVTEVIPSSETFEATNIVVSQNGCSEPGHTRICSDKGACISNECKCESIEVADEYGNIDDTYRYSGRYCEECPFCKGQRCLNYLECVICKIIEHSDNCSFCPEYFRVVNWITRNISNDDKMCEVEYIPGCFVKFKYFYRSRDIFLEAERIYQCFDGGTYLFYTFWGFVFFIVLLMVLTPNLCVIVIDKEQGSSNHYRSFRTDFNRRRTLYPEIRTA